jgi:hypothetical protein
MIRTLLAFTFSLAGTLSAADFLPLANGNFWTYRDAVTGSTFEVRVSTPYFLNGKVYHSLKGFSPQTILVRENEYGNIAMYDLEREQELLVTSFETSDVVGQFEAYGRQCPASGKAQKDLVEYTGPAGRWNATEVKFQVYGCADAGELSELYVENVGMVRRVVNTFAGPRTFDLVEAHIGKQVVNAGEIGRFTVSALPGADSASWQVTLKVDPTPSSGFKVKFSSGQEYDLKLRDSDGTIVWTWSADKLFVAAEHTLHSIGGWTAVVNVPHPITPADARAYVLEAYLTSAPGEPRFAAATTLTLSSLAGATASADNRRR